MTPTKTLPQQILRIIDVNLNRASEGLRVIEDIARLVLNDAAISGQIKAMRHRTVEGDLALNKQLVGARDARGDVGINLEVPGQAEEKDLPLVLVANSRRVQESLRTIEELTRTSGIYLGLDPESFKQSRFELYTIEQEIFSRLLRQDKARLIRGLCAIIDTQALKGRPHYEVAKQLIHGGAKIVQLRDKILTKKELVSVAIKLKELCAGHDVLFIINDHLDIALASDADGLHLGQNDLPIRVARQLLPMDKILGCSINTLEQAITAEADGADYIGVGSIYPTSSKEAAVIVEPERLRQVRQAVGLPIVAIGGINEDNAAEVISAGADAIAVISAILKTESPEKAARQIVARIEGVNG
ncbi:MAG: thiamine phosphate synthase [Dehalococcoidales bacterium]|nr:thiamine phosphate synthase [Dehalococcoidales bacterium]